MKISEAYATLGNAKKREQYDRYNLASQGSRSHASPRGSHSSASTPYGSRPASGLSRRRTQFKGPPPSFFRNGGWGAHKTRRQQGAEDAARAAQEESSARTAGGFGFGQGQAGFNNDVPHFDQEGHYRTQQSYEERARRRRQNNTSGYVPEGALDMAMRFVLVSSLVGLAYVPIWLFSRDSRTSSEREKRPR